MLVSLFSSERGGGWALDSNEERRAGVFEEGCFYTPRDLCIVIYVLGSG